MMQDGLISSRLSRRDSRAVGVVRYAPSSGESTNSRQKIKGVSPCSQPDASEEGLKKRPTTAHKRHAFPAAETALVASTALREAEGSTASGAPLVSFLCIPSTLRHFPWIAVHWEFKYGSWKRYNTMLPWLQVYRVFPPNPTITR